MATKVDGVAMFGGSKMGSLEEDFTYGVTVAKTNVSVRLGKIFREINNGKRQISVTSYVSRD